MKKEKERKIADALLFKAPKGMTWDRKSGSGVAHLVRFDNAPPPAFGVVEISLCGAEHYRDWAWCTFDPCLACILAVWNGIPT